MKLLSPKIAVKASFSPLSSSPFTEKVNTGVEWVGFGSDNLYPQRLLHALDSIGPLFRSIQVTAAHVAGAGLKVIGENDEEHKQAMDLWWTWMSNTTEEDFLTATAMDAVTLNARTWHVRRDTGGRISRLDHIDNSRTRAAKLVDGVTPGYYWSADWSKWRRAGYTPEFTPTYRKDERLPKQALYSKQYKSGKDSYSEPTYLPCLAAGETWMRVDHFNRTQLDTSFNSSVILFVKRSADKEQMDVMDEELEAAYCGALARGMCVVQLEPGEEPPVVQVVPKSNNAGSQDETRDKAAGVIYDTFGIPRILVTEQSTGLASQGLAIQESISKFYADLVRPFQFNHITKDLWRLFEDEGVKGIKDIRIKPISVFDSKEDPELARMAYLRSTKLNEHRMRQGLEEDVVNGEKYLIEIGPALNSAPAQPQQAPQKQVPEKKDGNKDKPNDPEEQDK